MRDVVKARLAMQKEDHGSEIIAGCLSALVQCVPFPRSGVKSCSLDNFGFWIFSFLIFLDAS